MKGKNLFKKIVASALTLTIVFSNVSVAAQDSSGEIPTETQAENQEDIQPQAEEAVSVESQEVSESAPADTQNETSSEPNSPEEDQTPTNQDIPSEEDTSKEEQSNGNTEPSEDQDINDAQEGETSTPPPSDEGDTTSDGTEDKDASDQPSNDDHTTDVTTSPEAPAPSPADQPSDNTQPSTEQQPTDQPEASQPVDPQPDAENPDASSDTVTTSPAASPEESADQTTEPGQPTVTPEQTPTAEPEDDSDDEYEAIDFDGLMSFDELMDLSEDEAGMTMWGGGPMFFSMCSMMNTFSLEPDEVEGLSEKINCGFGAYYVNQDDPYNVTKTNNFNLKYQMEFHTDSNLEEGSVYIRVPSALMPKRHDADTPEEYVEWSEIAVPQGTSTEDGKFTYNRRTPFNYFIDGDDIVFFNYRKIPAGTNAAWQILYKNVRLMEIEDGTEWTLTPQISINEGKTPYDTIKEAGFEDFEKSLTGKIDSSVSLTSVTKTAYDRAGSNYTPGLYTASQVKQFIEGEIPDEYLIGGSDGSKRLNTEKYHFAVWEVKVNGNATQPWDLYIKEKPVDAKGQNGYIVGYKDNASASASYNHSIKKPTKVTDSTSVFNTYDASSQNVQQESWASCFYVVTAYDNKASLVGQEIKNDITIALDPRDGKDPDVEMSATTASWKYEEYDWTYSGKILNVDKKTDINKYTGWMSAYRQAREAGEDYGRLPFSITAGMYGYGKTHETKGDNLGQYKEKTYYTMTTADDVVYIESQGTKKMLTGDDYYFSDVTIQQTDYGYDVWEDQTDVSELGKIQTDKLPQNFDRNIRVYAMFSETSEKIAEAKDEGLILAASNNWMQLNIDKDKFEWDASGAMKPYQLEQEYLALRPYRIKVEHDAIDFRSECKIDVEVCMRSSSKVLGDIVDAYGENEATKSQGQEVVIENLAALMGTSYEADGIKTYQGDNKHYDSYANFVNLENKNLTDVRKVLYQDGRKETELPMSGNASRTLTWLKYTSEATKSSKTTNDVENSRGLVEYMLTAYDGYEVYDKECLDYLYPPEQQELMEQFSPGRTHVVFYDLLPYGMNFDASYPVTAGRITDLSGRYSDQPGRWNKTQVSVTVTEDDIVPNYRGTGRTRVAFHIAYSGAETTSYTMGKWIEGWGLHFRAYYDWKDVDIINQKNKDTFANSNLCAFMPDFSERAEHSNDGKWRLYGLDGDVFCDNGNMPQGYGDLVGSGNIDGYSFKTTRINKENVKEEVEVDKTYPNVLYAKHPLTDDITTAFTSGIETLVRADTEHLGTFSESAEVEVSDKEAQTPKVNYYTYNISVTAGADCRNIIIYDNLENANIDRTEGDNDPFYPFDEKPWHGVLESVDIKGLKSLDGTVPVVYGSFSTISQSKGKLEAGQSPINPKETEGWEKLDNMTAEEKAKVKAIAVVVGENFTLKANHTISFQIKMQAPDKADIKDIEVYKTHAYNCASFYSEYMQSNAEVRSIEEGNAARVGLTEQTETLEIIKKITGEVPGARKGESFEFFVYTTPLGVDKNKVPLNFAEYELFQYDEQNKRWDSKGVRGVSGNGYLSLTDGQKAVFTRPGASKIQVEEKASVFWESNVSTETKGNVTTKTVTNTFHPVLYVQKTLASVPEGITLNKDQKTFTFQLKDVNGAPIKADYWYVDRADTTGATPEQKPNADKKIAGTTDENGIFTLRAGEIIALFPGTAGVTYELRELQFDEEVDGNKVTTGKDWICTSPVTTVKLPANGFSKIFVNYYRWKDLYVTKEIRSLEKEDYDRLPTEEKEFAFQVFEAELNEDGTVKLDSDNKPIPKERADGKLTTEGLRWEFVPSAPGDNSADNEPLDEDGIFTCALGFRTVRIIGESDKGFEADKIYIVQELTDSDHMPQAADQTGERKDLYKAVIDADQVKMPVYSDREEATITNDYQRRSLSVSKDVIFSGIRPETEPVFDFKIQAGSKTAEVRYPYTIVDAQGNEIENGTIPNGGIFQLSDGQTAVFKDIGMLGDSFSVCEKVDSNYPQIVPMMESNPSTGYGELYSHTLSEEENKISFINGEKGNLYINKEYVAADKGEIYSETLFINELKNWIKSSYMGSDGDIVSNSSGYWNFEDSASVEFSLKVTKGNETYTWPKTDTMVNVINPYQSNEEHRICSVLWKAGQPIKVYPWYLIQIPSVAEGDDGEKGDFISSNNTYVLEEVEEYQHRIIGGRNGYFEVSQYEPADDQAVTGTPKERSIAKIYNQAAYIPQTADIYKKMTEASDPVPTGAKLTWRVEQYQGGQWYPAKDIAYVVFNKTGNDLVPVSNQIERTKDGEDKGKIICLKEESGYPVVWFPENPVYVNLCLDEDIQKLSQSKGVVNTGGKLLRVVEVPEESNPKWGKLTGYGSYSDSYSLDWRPYIESTDTDGKLLGYPYAKVFVNSNKEETIAVKKSIPTGAVSTDQPFTLILKQVVSIVTEDEMGSTENIQKYLRDYSTDEAKAMINSAVLEPRGEISYTIHKVNGTEEVGTTTSEGEIKLCAGEYATLNLPQGTLWTVSENLQSVPTYKLKDLTPDYTEDPKNTVPLRKLEENKVLINLMKPAPKTLTVTWVDENGTTVLDGPKTFDAGGVEPSTDVVPTKAAGENVVYIFDKWERSEDKDGNVIYRATYASISQITVTWIDVYDDSIVSQRTIDEGSDYSSMYPPAPNHQSEGYNFGKWGAPITDENTGNITITTIYLPLAHNIKLGDSSDSKEIEYRITIINPNIVKFSQGTITLTINGAEWEIGTEKMKVVDNTGKEITGVTLEVYKADGKVIFKLHNLPAKATITIDGKAESKSDNPKTSIGSGWVL